jgi:hypothetical protein
MLTLNDLHSQLDEALAINSIESSFSYEYYTDLINGQRELWLRNEYNKNRSIDPYILQELPCLELELVNPIQCCIDVPEGCKVLRSKKQIPNTIEFHHSKALVSVGPADITKPRFSVIDYSRVPYIGHGRTTQRTIYAFLYGSYLYIISRSTTHLMMNYITARGLFSNPTALGEFINCQSGNQCWTPDSPYPLNMWMWEYMKPIIIQQLIEKSKFVHDDANDTDDIKIDK